MPGTLKVSNWGRWQSYRADRGQPPWIKLHRQLLRNHEWAELSDAAKAHLVSIWMLAADRGGEVPDNAPLIKKLCYLDAPPDLDELVTLGFLERQPDVSATTNADATATPRRRQPDATATPSCLAREETETETETEKRQNTACAEPLARSTPEPVILLPLAKNGAEAEVTAEQVAEWREAYPGVDVDQALRNMRQWLIHNPTKRKTPRGIGRFITSWLAREQDRGGKGGGGARESPIEMMQRLQREGLV